MAAGEEQVTIEVVLDDGSVKNAFTTLRKQGEEAASSLGERFGSLQTKVVAALAGIAGAFTLREAIGEAIQAENAITKFNLSLANAGNFSKEASESFQAYAQTLSDVVAVDNDLIIENAALLVSLGKLSGEGLERATKAAVDLSAGLGISLESAFELLSKAATGATGSLGRYGIKVSESIPPSERFANALGQIEQRFGGLSEGLAGGTFQGALTRLSIGFSNFLESIGNFFVQSPALRETINLIADAFNSLTKSINSFSGGDIIGSLLTGLATLGQAIIIYVAAPFEGLVNVFIVGLKTINFAFQAFGTVIAGVGTLIVQAIVIPIQQFFEGVGILVNLFDQNFGQKIIQKSREIASGITEPLVNTFNAISTSAGESFDSLAASADNALTARFSETALFAIENYKTKINEAAAANDNFKNSSQETAEVATTSVTSIGEAFAAVADGASMELEDLRKNSVKVFQDIGRAAIQGIGNGVGNAFAQFGKALVTGEDALGAFTKAFLQAIGQQAVAAGTRFILEGIAYLFVPGFQGVGAAMISAGAALATFGGVISAVAGGGAGAPAAGTPGGSPLQTTGPAFDGGTGGGGINEDIERQAPNTEVSVVIQGDVLDSEETGLRIVDLINRSFDKQGVIIKRGALA